MRPPEPIDPKQRSNGGMSGGPQEPTSWAPGQPLPGAQPVAPKKTVPAPPSRGRRFVRTLGYVLFCAFFLLAGTVGGWLLKSDVVRAVIANFNVSPQAAFEKPSVTLLILGCDEELAPGGKKVLKKAGRSDMMLLAKLDFATGTVTGVSIPRDTRCSLPGYGTRKINAYHNIAKPERADALTQEAVEFLLPGVKIDRVLTVDYVAFTELVDLLGGVEVTVEKRMKYEDRAASLYIDLYPGKQILDGYNAMGFVRFRHSDSDFKRQERQKNFLLALKKRMQEKWLLLPQVADAGVAVFGNSLSGREIAGLANFSKKLKPTDVKLLPLPTKPGRGTFLELDRRKAEKLLRETGLLQDAMASNL